jgi:hypothetical protein
MQITNARYAAWATVLSLGVLATASASAQSFSSGSTGSDGALNLTTPGVVIFNPKSFSPALDPSGDNVFNFTTINIAAGVIVKLQGNVLNGPITWLATGNVTINGTIDLSGQSGINLGTGVQRAPAIPGSGGYGGGIGGLNGNPATPGFGPAGGSTSGCANGGGIANPGGFSGNQFLIPLVGGSGGGAYSNGGGGAGGGAILIASSTGITVSGSIIAPGGAQSYLYAGPGAGGGIRLVANTLSLAASSSLDVHGGHGTYCTSVAGNVRLEAFQISPLGTITGNLYSGTPFGVFLNSTGPAISVVSVGGVAVATSPTGTFTMPDVTVNSSGALTTAIQAQNVPLGTVVTMLVYSENGPDQTIQSTGLAGTLASSTATAQVTLPPGFSLGLIKATWTQ